MPEQPHPYETVAHDLFDWIKNESPWYADAIRGGHRSPFAAPVSEADKHDYYRRQMFQVAPDDTIQYDKPNVEGRAALINTLGVQGYAQIYEAVRPKQGMRPAVAPTEDSDIPEPPEDQNDAT